MTEEPDIKLIMKQIQILSGIVKDLSKRVAKMDNGIDHAIPKMPVKR
ncbi:hypothetical protein [Phyllobacterium phragmitis]|nr:hypothetical protein [Phyllobacterium phragmitis]